MKDIAFTPITLTGKEQYLHLREQTPCRSLDYTLANLWGWAGYYGLEWCFAHGLCWLRQTHPQEAFWAPVGPWDDVDWADLPCLRDGASLVRVPEALVRRMEAAMPGRIAAEEARGQWEYLYKTEDMATLPGNRYHKKKNHYNAYVKAYGEPDYRPLTLDVMEDVLALQDEWCQWHECVESPALQAENEAINRVLAHWDDIPGLIGGSLYAEGQMVAFSVGEKLDDTTLGVHYEKGRNGYRGVYQAMNRCFAQRAGQGYALLNRAQDLDEEGLRQAKTGYLPTDFLRKYTVEVAAASTGN